MKQAIGPAGQGVKYLFYSIGFMKRQHKPGANI